MGGGGNFFEDLVDTVTQVSTGGIIGFKDGKLGTGAVTDAAVGVVKDVTGASAAEEANKDARARFEAEKQAAEKQRADQKAQTAADQTAASRRAGAARGTSSRSTSSRGTSSTGGSGGSLLGSDEQDFLGL